MKCLTKCMSETCPVRDKCFRVLAPVDYHTQSWAMFIWNAEDGKCEHFLDPTAMKQVAAKERKALDKEE